MKLIRIYLSEHMVLPFKIWMGVIFFYFCNELINALITGVGIGNGGILFERDTDIFGYYTVLFRDTSICLLSFWLAIFGTKQK